MYASISGRPIIVWPLQVEQHWGKDQSAVITRANVREYRMGQASEENAEKLKDSASALKAVKVESVKTVLLGEIRVP